VYRSTFPTDPAVDARLQEAGIIGGDETVRHMVTRVVESLADADQHFAGATGSATFAERLGWQIDAGRVVFSAPVMANAGRFTNRPLVTCAAPSVDLAGELVDLRASLERHVHLGLGTGLRFDDVADPLALLHYLNHVAVVEAATGAVWARPVEHAALLSLSHPRAEGFVSSMVGAGAAGERWRFNVALAVTDTDMRAAVAHGGRERAVLLSTATAALAGAGPGLLFVDRLEAHNPAPKTGAYVATSPAGEVGLLAGETCTFGQVNVGKFFRPHPAGPVPIDFGALADTVYTLVRALDDAVEASAAHHPTALSAKVTGTTRKIGVGVCGLADLLHAADVDYASRDGRHLAQEVLAYLNHVAKLASIDLAVTRGACAAVGNGRSRYASPGFLRRFADVDVRSVTVGDWGALAERVAVSGMLRNASITALAPTHDGAPVVGASEGIEPLPKEPVDPLDQLTMAAAAQACVDEGVATTLRLPAHATVVDIYDLFMAAWELGCTTVRSEIAPGGAPT
jgi:ribonucleoside-diphosphate reductase alpha chain